MVNTESGVRCGRCAGANVTSEYDVLRVEEHTVASKRAAVVDVGCACDVPAAAAAAVADDVTGAGAGDDVVDDGCALIDALQHSDDSKLPKDPIHRQTVDLLSYKNCCFCYSLACCVAICTLTGL